MCGVDGLIWNICGKEKRGHLLFELWAPLRDRLVSRQHPRRLRIQRREWPAVVYAVGDVHGCHEQLKLLETIIVADAQSFQGERLIVMMGDYVDRGPASARVIDHLIQVPPAGFERICLAGNHDDLMFQFLAGEEDGRRWLGMGGDATLHSYGIDVRAIVAGGRSQRRLLTRSHVPVEHEAFLANLPLAFSLPGVTFVHACTRAGLALDVHSDRDLLWMRPDPNEDVRRTETVVHGHTPGNSPVDLPFRVCVDTAAFATGRLTAVRLLSDGSRHFLST